MSRDLIHRGLWLAATAGLLFALSWLDAHRGGPASVLSRCNLLLSRSETPAADVLIIGSSRTGTALDPVAMRSMLAHSSTAATPTVERLAIARSPLRATHALLENYLETRGAPKVLALEIMFQTERGVERLAALDSSLSPEQYVFRRDINLMTFSQILGLPAVAMPFSESDSELNLWRLRLRGIALRAGALVYQFLRHPLQPWTLATCDPDAWIREPSWPADFTFSFGHYQSDADLPEVIDALESRISKEGSERVPKPWQSESGTEQHYPYDFAEPYREGEVTLLRSMLDLASGHGIPVVLLPLPLYGYEIDPEDMDDLADLLPERTHVFDLYGAAEVDLQTFWYDDGHVEVELAGALTTAMLARHLLESGLLGVDRPAPPHD